MLGFGVLVLFLVGFLAYLWFTVDLPKNLPEVQASVVYDAKGRPIASLTPNGTRIEVKLAQVSPSVVDALVSSEDRNFFEHHGVDPVGTLRAVWNDVRGNSLQGGSTITQQLVKNDYLSSDRSLLRKAKEAVLSIKLENTLDKNQILERYLNTVYFGRGTYGIEAAAHAYFNTSAAQLNPGQSAMLVGLLSAPEAADPSTNPQAAQTRRNNVLDAMVATGRLKQDDANAAKMQPLGAVDRQTESTVQNVTAAPWFVEMVREQAVAQFGEAAVYGGGLRINTTLDLDDQKAAEDAVAQVLNDPADPQAALVAVDTTGAIKAYVGGRDYNALKIDEARGAAGGGSGRQEGSTFKPFVLAAGVDSGTRVAQQFPAPAQIDLPTDSGPWHVSNFGDESFPPLNLLDATAHSVNTVYAQLVLQVGPDKAVAMAHAAGIASPLPDTPSVALGTGETSPLEVADAYLTFARRGERVDTFAIASVQDRNGNVVEQAHPTTSRAMKPETADVVNLALQGVIKNGTGTAAQLDRPVAGKTGTTENNGDAWFAGYTPNYAAAVWMGYPEGSSRPMDDVHGISVTGGTLPAQIWQKFMTAALTDVPVANFTPPPPDLLAPAPAPCDAAAASASSPSDGASAGASSVSEPCPSVPAPAPSLPPPVLPAPAPAPPPPTTTAPAKPQPPPEPTTTTTSTTSTTTTTTQPKRP